MKSPKKSQLSSRSSRNATLKSVVKHNDLLISGDSVKLWNHAELLRRIESTASLQRRSSLENSRTLDLDAED